MGIPMGRQWHDFGLLVIVIPKPYQSQESGHTAMAGHIEPFSAGVCIVVVGHIVLRTYALYTRDKDHTPESSRP